MKNVYFFHDNGRFRIWLSDSPGDIFDVVSALDLTDKLSEYVTKGYQLVAGPPEEDEPATVAVWRCQSCGHIDDKTPLPKDRTAYYANPKPRKCPKCKAEDMCPEGF